jgi:hypothetical protein
MPVRDRAANVSRSNAAMGRKMGSPDAGGRIGASTTCARELGRTPAGLFYAVPIAGPCSEPGKL